MPRLRNKGSVLGLGLSLILASAAAPAQEKPAAPAQETPRPFSMPAAFRLFTEPPFRFHDNRTLIVVFKAVAEVVRRLVPEPLVPNPAGLMFVYFGRLNVETPPLGDIRYLEAGIGVPAIFPATGVLGNYAVCLYLDEALPIAAGREIWGWPKKDAEMAFQEENGRVECRVERHGKVLMSLRATPARRIPVASAQPQLPWFLQKIIPSPRKNAPPEVWQLVSVMNIESTTKELWSCTAELGFASGPNDPLGDFEVLGIVSAQLSVGGFTMDYGAVIHDYLARK